MRHNCNRVANWLTRYSGHPVAVLPEIERAHGSRIDRRVCINEAIWKRRGQGRQGDRCWASLLGIEGEQLLDLLEETTQDLLRPLRLGVVRFARDMPGHVIQIAEADLHRHTRRGGSDLVLNSFVEIHEPGEEQCPLGSGQLEPRLFRRD